MAERLHAKLTGQKAEAFCPTGDGNGQDNSCSSREGGGDEEEHPAYRSSSGVETVNDIRVYRNPTLETAKAWLQKFGPLRGMTNKSTGETFIWPANRAWHVEVAQALGFGKGDLESREGQRTDVNIPGRWVAHTPTTLEKMLSASGRKAVMASGGSEGEFMLSLAEAFCPTGEGHGQDNSCPPASKGSGGDDRNSDEASDKADFDREGRQAAADVKSASTAKAHEPVKPNYNEGDPVDRQGKVRALGVQLSEMKPEVRSAVEAIEKEYPPADPEANDTYLRHVVSLDEHGKPKFTPARERLHQRMLDEVRAHVPPSQGQPEFVLMGGGPSSGKSTVVDAGLVTLDQNTVRLNVDDDFKFKIPEYVAMTKAGDQRAAMFAHEESSTLAKRAMSESFADSQNVMLDGTGDAGLKSVLKKIDEAHAAGYKTRAEYMSNSIENALKLADRRGQKTGRYVPRQLLINTHKNVSQIVPELIKSGKVDFLRVWDTDASTPEGRPSPRLIAEAHGSALKIIDPKLWEKFLAKAHWQEATQEATMTDETFDPPIPLYRQHEILSEVVSGLEQNEYDSPAEAEFRAATLANVRELRSNPAFKSFDMIQDWE